MFENGIALVLSESLEREQDCKIISLSRIAKEYMFNNSDLFNGKFSQGCQQRSVLPSLLTLI